MIDTLYIEKIHTIKPPEDKGENTVNGKEEKFISLLNQYINLQGEQRVVSRKADSAPAKNRIKKKNSAGENRIRFKNLNAHLKYVKGKSPRAGRLKDIILKGKGNINKAGNKVRDHDYQTETTHINRSLNRSIHYRIANFKNRKVLIQKYSVKKGKKLYFKKPESGKSEQPVRADVKRLLSNTIESKEKIVEKGVKGKSTNFRGTKKFTTTALKANAFENLLKNEQTHGNSFRAGEASQGGKELSFACVRYESNIPKVLVKPDYQVLKNADEIFNEIVKQFSLIVSKGGGEANIVLQPELLGKIKLNLKLNQHEINSVIIVDNQSVKDLIISKLNILEQNLLQHGFSLGSFQVEVNDSQAGFNTAGEGIGEKSNTKNSADKDKELNENTVMILSLPWISTVVNVTV